MTKIFLWITIFGLQKFFLGLKYLQQQQQQQHTYAKKQLIGNS